MSNYFWPLLPIICSTFLNAQTTITKKEIKRYKNGWEEFELKGKVKSVWRNWYGTKDSAGIKVKANKTESLHLEFNSDGKLLVFASYYKGRLQDIGFDHWAMEIYTYDKERRIVDEIQYYDSTKIFSWKKHHKYISKGGWVIDSEKYVHTYPSGSADTGYDVLKDRYNKAGVLLERYVYYQPGTPSFHFGLSYDKKMRLLKRWDTGSGYTLLFSHTYDKSGRCISENYKATYSDGNQNIDKTVTHYYDSLGRETKAVWSDFSSDTIYKYNSKGYVKTVHNNTDNKISIYTFNNNNDTTLTVVYTQSPKSCLIINYNSKGQPVVYSSYSLPDSTLYGKTINAYDENGNISNYERINYDAMGKIFRDEVYKYNIDKGGNWLKAIVTSGTELYINEQEIEYYK